MEDEREDDMEEQEVGDDETEEALYSKMYMGGSIMGTCVLLDIYSISSIQASALTIDDYAMLPVGMPPGINLSAEQMREIEIREQDRFLPVANIARIMKKSCL